MSGTGFEAKFLGFLDGAIQRSKKSADRAMVQFVVLRLTLVVASASLPALTTIDNRSWSTGVAVLLPLWRVSIHNFDGVRNGDTSAPLS